MIELVAATLGWILAGLAFGLWLGERGRRQDLQWLAEAATGPRQTRSLPATVDVTTADPEAAELEEIQVESTAVHLFEVAAGDGEPVTMDEARAEAKRLLTETERFGGLPV